MKRRPLQAATVSTNHRKADTSRLKALMDKWYTLLNKLQAGIHEASRKRRTYPESCDHVRSTVRYLMHFWSVAGFRCVLSFRQDRVTFRVWTPVSHWRAESAGCQHLWQLGNQGHRSPPCLIHSCLQLYIPHTRFVFRQASGSTLQPLISPPYSAYCCTFVKRWLNWSGCIRECRVPTI